MDRVAANDALVPAWWRPSRLQREAGIEPPSLVRARAQPSGHEGTGGSILVPTGLPTGERGIRPTWAQPEAWKRDEVNRAVGRASAVAEGFDGERLHAAYADLVIGRGPQIVVHVPPQYSFPTHGLHVKAAREFQRLYELACGVRPEVWVAVQQNAKGKPGEHSHWLACGSADLRQVNRRSVWESLRATISGFPGVDQPGRHAWTRAGHTLCSMCGGRHPEREWQPAVPNAVRLRIEPVEVNGSARNSASIAYYVVRYVVREDVETAFYNLPGRGFAHQQAVPC